MRYDVIVGNIGNVYQGNDYEKARKTFSEYCNQSKNGYGRAAGESVVLMVNSEVSKEFLGKMDLES